MTSSPPRALDEAARMAAGRPVRGGARSLLSWGLGVWLMFGAAGCAVPAHQQRLVSKLNMTFTDSVIFNYHNKLIPQVEPGSAFSGGAQVTGCTSCK